MGFSNYLIGILNFATIVLSLPIIGGGIWLATKHDTDCVRFLQWPIVLIGLFILLVSIVGFVGACFRISCLLCVYLLVMLMLILLLLFFTVFAFVVTHSGAGHALAGQGFKEYRLGDYSTWLQNKVDNAENWRSIKSCLSDAKVCNSLNEEYSSLQAFSRARLSPLQSGCCKPPTACGYSFVNPTSWVNPTIPSANQDCLLWNNQDLCFNCGSCRAGVLQNIKEDWHKVAILNVVVLIFLFAVYSIGCCACRNARRDGSFSGFGKPFL
ncbi:hypothetical protein O6H91_03G003900 [Diphasiastrum complanatum]|uniref:Uncharacterized protein n=1 Tax=Diphasiastrum complanatum TaxID=34168 RepID=A0ACC2E3A9_DIPCM|nr:hypothetical protein O6H91_03G003900 [Diphasiastrum complanatum]